MAQIYPIDDPSVYQRFSSMKDKQQQRLGDILVDSPKVVLRMLRAGVAADEILCTNQFGMKTKVSLISVTI